MKSLFRDKRENGAISLMTVFALIVLMAFTALAIDFGMYYYKSAKLQNAVDSAATAVAQDLTATRESQKRTAQKYLTANGFDDKKYEIVITPDVDGVMEEESSVYAAAQNENWEDEVYLTSGYLKLNVRVKDHSILGSLFDIPYFHLNKTAYVRVKADYITMPKALRYTLFAGSTEDTAAGEAAMQIKGRLGSSSSDYGGALINIAVSGFENFINAINSHLVQPLIGFFGGTPNYSDLMHITLSQMTNNGDVHSNSRITLGEQTLQSTRWKDDELRKVKLGEDGEPKIHQVWDADNEKWVNETQTVQSTYIVTDSDGNPVVKKDSNGNPLYDENGDYVYETATKSETVYVYEYDPVETNANIDAANFYDYGQVTYTAVGAIDFEKPLGLMENTTHIYVQNQQQLEVTQHTLNIVNLIPETNLRNTSALKASYVNYANIYLASYKVTESQREAILAQQDNLSYVSASGTEGTDGYVPEHIKLINQDTIIYDIRINTANGMLDAVEEQGFSGLLKETTDNGADRPFSSGTSTLLSSRYDQLDTNGNDYVTTLGANRGSMAVYVYGHKVNRDYGNLQDDNSTYSGDTKYNRTSISTAAKYSVANTFLENLGDAGYIETPNMKPYFVRQVNKSVSLATQKEGEIANTTVKGDVSVKKATKTLVTDLKKEQDLEKLQFLDDSLKIDLKKTYTYEENGTNKSYTFKNGGGEFMKTILTKVGDSGDQYVFNAANLATKDHALMFQNHKQNAGALLTANTESVGSFGYSKIKYKTVELYNTDGTLKTPGDVCRDEFEQDGNNNITYNTTTKKASFTTDPVQQYYNDNIKNQNNQGYEAVQAKKNELVKYVNASATDDLGNKNYYKKYSDKKTESKTKIDRISLTVNEMSNAGSQVINPPTLPNLPDVFLGIGNSGNVNLTNRNEGKRKAFDDFIKTMPACQSSKITVSNDTYTAPALPSYPSFPSVSTSGGSAFGGNNCSSDQYMTNGSTYSKAETPYNTSCGTNRFDMYVTAQAAANVTGNVKVDNGIKLDVLSGTSSKHTVLKVGGKFYTDGGDTSKLFVRQYAEMYVKGNIESRHNDTTMEVTGKLHVNGEINTDSSKRTKLYVKQGGEVYAGSYTMKGENDYIEVEGKLHVNGRTYFNWSGEQLVVKSTGKVYTGSVECNDSGCSIDVYGFMQVSGDISTSGGTANKNREFNINVKNGGTLVVNGSISNQWKDHITVESGGVLIVQNLCKATRDGAGSINISGTLIQLSASNIIDSNIITVNSGGKIYSVGNINSDHPINCAGGSIYTLSNIIAANNDSNGRDVLNISGASYIYVRGVITSEQNNRHLYIHDGSNSVVSVLGAGNTGDCFNGKLGQIFNDQSGAKLYFGTNVSVGTAANEFAIHSIGSMYVWGNLNYTGGNKTFELSGAGVTYVTGNVNANNTTITLSGGHLLYVGANIIASGITVTGNSNVHADDQITVSGALNIETGSQVEGLGGTTYGSVGGSAGAGGIASATNMVFSGSVNYHDIGSATSENTSNDTYVYDGFIQQGSASISSLTLSNVKVKINGDLNVSGNILLENNTVLVVTGSITGAGTITLYNSKAHIYGGINNCTALNVNDSSLLLTRTAAKDSTAHLTSSGKTSVSGSRLYVDGNLKSSTLKASGSSAEVLAYAGYKISSSLNSTDETASGTVGYIWNDNNATIFCGDNSTTKPDSTNNSIGLILDGPFYYPNGNGGQNYVFNKLHIKSNGKLIYKNKNVTINNWVKVESGGVFYNDGPTTISNCKLTNDGKCYMVGSVAYNASGTSSTTPDILYGRNDSETYIGQISGGTLTYTGYYSGRGNVWIDNNLVVNGALENGSNNQSGNSVAIGSLIGCSLNIESGTTYVSGNVTTCNNNGELVAQGAGLSIGGNWVVGSCLYNEGSIHIMGTFSVSSSSTRPTDRNIKKTLDGDDTSKIPEGISIRNGSSGNTNAMFFVRTSNNIVLRGYVHNYAKYYYAGGQSIQGWNAVDHYGSETSGKVDFAIIGFPNSISHIMGTLCANGNAVCCSDDAVMSVGGNLDYGQCLYNTGKLYVTGNIVQCNNNVNSNKYKDNEHFSLKNGTHTHKGDNSAHVVQDTHAAVLYCGGDITLGTNESNGDAGSLVNFDRMFVRGSVYEYTNRSNSHTRMAIHAWNNSTTVIAGDIFAGGGVAEGDHSIFMCGGNMRTKRSLKVGVHFFYNYGAITDDPRAQYSFYNAEKQGDSDSSIWESSGIAGLAANTFAKLFSNWSRFNNLASGATAPQYGDVTDYKDNYFYVGGTLMANTLGGFLWGDNLADYTQAVTPEQFTGDLNFYSNTNAYIGGSLFARSSVRLGENCVLEVAGSKKLKSDYSTINTDYTDTTKGDLTLAVLLPTYVNSNNAAMFVYGAFEQNILSKVVVNGNMYVNNVAKIRDMNKNFINGNFICSNYVELGKGLNNNDGDYSEASSKYTNASKDIVTKNSYYFENQGYMHVNGEFYTGSYLKMFASQTLVVKKDCNVCTNALDIANITKGIHGYLTLRHDAKLYVGEDLNVLNSIDGGSYSEIHARGSIEAQGASLASLATLGLPVGSNGTIKVRDCTKVVCGGNMVATSYIELGKRGDYTRDAMYTCPTCGANFNKPCTTSSNKFCPECAANGVVSEGTLIKVKDSLGLQLNPSDTQTSAVGSGWTCSNGHSNAAGASTCSTCGEAKPTSGEGDEGSYSSSSGEQQDEATGIENDSQPGYGDSIKSQYTKDVLYNESDDTDDSLGGYFYIGGKLCSYGGAFRFAGNPIDYNSYIYIFKDSRVAVGSWVLANKNITLHKGADLWVLPEAFENFTYVYQPYVSTTDTSNLIGRIIDRLREIAYNINEFLRSKEGDVYCMGSLEMNSNSSILATHDALVQGQLIMRESTLMYLGGDFTCVAPSLTLNLNALTGKTSLTGFFTKGKARQVSGKQYTCTNKAGHDTGGSYTWQVADKYAGATSNKCPLCGNTIGTTKSVKVQLTFPAVIYANETMNIMTTTAMELTYLITNRGNLNFYDIYSSSTNADENLEQLPNAMASYQKDIKYFAMYGKINALMYAPEGLLDIDGYYLDFWGCGIGDTVTVNTYYANIHRFSNWKTMNLRIAESTDIELISESDYEYGVDIANKWDESYIDSYYDADATGASLFFSSDILNGEYDDDGD